MNQMSNAKAMMEAIKAKLRASAEAAAYERHDVIFSDNETQAGNPDDFRQNRLRVAFGAASMAWAIFTNGDPLGCVENFAENFFRWHDHKGNLTVFLRRQMTPELYNAVRLGWQSESEEDFGFSQPGYGHPRHSAMEERHDLAKMAQGVLVRLPHEHVVRYIAGDDIRYFETGLAQEVIEWCDETFGYQPALIGDCAFFRTDANAVEFKLRWGGA